MATPQDYRREVNDLITVAGQQGASDLHVTVGHPPTLRIDGELIQLTDRDIVTHGYAQGFAFALLNETQQQRFTKEKELDFAFSFQDKVRLRANIYYQQGSVGVALRLIPSAIRTIEELNLPKTLYDFTRPTQGFVLVTGPTGHGKSTTLAALIDKINKTRAEHVVTIEDPVEYLFAPQKAIIDQREVGHDTLGFHRALRSAFRQDADVIMLGEMRDRETISTAVTAAETGHLIFATLHTNSASQTISRIIDSFPAEQQDQIRTQLAGALLGVISQRLVPRLNGGLIPAVEVLRATYAVRNLIRENKVPQIDVVIETGTDQDMISLNRSLASLVRRGEISLQTAEIYSLDPSALNTIMGR